LRQILLADAALAQLAERRQREHTVLQLVQRELPQALAAHVSTVSAEAQELSLVATSGAAAALLRQRAPTLLGALNRSGRQFTVIHVCVQARSASSRTEKRPIKQIDAVSAARLRARARKLPDPALSEALLRLASSCRRRDSDDDPSDTD
jgi:hypothetical protein